MHAYELKATANQAMLRDMIHAYPLRESKGRKSENLISLRVRSYQK